MYMMLSLVILIFVQQLILDQISSFYYYLYLNYYVKLHDLPEDIAKPAEEVFDLASLQKEKDAKKNLQAFIDTANQIDLSENPGDVYNNLKKMADEDNIDEEVYNICVDELKKAEESQFND